MANISSFFGELYFRTDDKPWTPEGILAAFDVLMSQDSGGGDYGFCMEEDATEDSATFLVKMLEQLPNDPVILYWGSGRWSAENNFDSFNSWTKNKSCTQTMSEETYLATRAKLLHMMVENKWFFEFEYTDEEGGTGFITKQDAVISAVASDSGEESFYPIVATSEDYEYNLKNYSEQIEECRTENRFYEQMSYIYRILNICKEDEEKFNTFVTSQDWDEKMSPWSDYESIEELPEGLVDAWEVYKNVH